MKKNNAKEEKYYIGMRREFMSLSKDATKEFVAEGLTISQVHERLGKIVHEMMRDGYDLDGCNVFRMCLYKSACDIEEREIVELAIIGEDGKTAHAISYPFVCKHMTKDDTDKVVEQIRKDIYLISGHSDKQHV